MKIVMSKYGEITVGTAIKLLNEGGKLLEGDDKFNRCYVRLWRWKDTVITTADAVLYNGKKFFISKDASYTEEIEI